MRPSVWLVLAASILHADNGKLPITATDLLKIHQVVDVAVATDGSMAVYAVKSIHTEMPADGKGEPVYSYRTNLWRIDLGDANAKPVQLTFGDKSDSGAAISPDGKKLAFVRTGPSNSDTSNKERPRPQVWLMPLTLGGEAQVLTSLENGASRPVWRGDSKALLVTSAIPLSKIPGKPQFGMERPARDWFDYERPAPNAKPEDPKPVAKADGDRAAIRQWLETNASKDNPTVITRMNFQDEQSLEREIRVPQVWLVEVENNKATQLTRGFYPHSGCAWSPDSARIACMSVPASNEHLDRVRRSNIVVINLKDRDRRVVLDRSGFSFSDPHWYPDGKALLVGVQELDDFRMRRIARLDLTTEDHRILTGTWDSAAQGERFASDGSILFGTSWQGGFPLKRLSESGELANVVSEPAGVTAFDEGAGRIVYAQTRVGNPNELYVREKDGTTRQVTELNSQWLASKEISLPETYWLTRPDGTKVQYWVMKPISPDSGKKYPWVLDMHGGPAAMWGPGEFSMWHEFQTFCAWGYGVVYANPRGSAGYGSKFLKANFKNWGEGPSGDVLAALDEAVKKYPMIDTSRLFLTGGSYAGYLTAWIVGHDNRFKAAAAQRGVYELTTFFGEGNAYRLVENSFGGLPWEPDTRKILERESPFTYVSKIRTPLLILHGSQDHRTGVSQSEMLYRALKQQGKPVEYIRYPNIGHELTRSGPPLQRMDHMLRIVEFFERYANNDHEAPIEKPAAPLSASSGSR